MDRIRWGIIGCGDVTEKKSGPAFSLVENSSLVAVMRRDAAKAADYAARHGVPRWYSDAGKLIADPDVDAVYIATPPDSHCEYAIAAANAGKAVYVEKPMAKNADECRRMIEKCSLKNVPLFVAYYRRALPRFLKIRELVDSHSIGDIRSVHTVFHAPPSEAETGPNPPWRVFPEISGGGNFLDLASHTLDFLDFILGPIDEARGIAVNQAGLYPAEDNVVAVFRFKSGVTGSGSWIFNADQKADKTEIIGSRGTISFASFADVPVVLQKGGERTEFSIPHPAHIQQPLIQTIVDELDGKGKCPSTGESAMRTARVMDAIVKSYYAGTK